MKLTRISAVTILLLVANAHLDAQITTLCSVTSSGAQANSTSSATASPSVSGDGRMIAFESNATNLVAGDTNFNIDVFVHDRQTGVTVCVSVDPSGVPGVNASELGGISNDGRWVVFASASSSLVPGDTNNNFDVFVRDLQNGITELVSVNSAGVQGVSGSLEPSISADGRYVAFRSAGLNLVNGGDANGSIGDILVRDRVAGTTTLVNVSTAGVQAQGDHSTMPAISADGRRVAFVSGASNLVPGDTNGTPDVFVRDLALGTTTRVSVSSSGTEADGSSIRPAISGDGRFVVFESRATNLVPADTNGKPDVFVRDLLTGTTRRVSVTSTGGESHGTSTTAAISADGRWVSFESDADNLVPSDTNFVRDVFMRDLVSGVTLRAGLTYAGTQVHDGSIHPALSGDGQFVAFVTFSADVVPGDTNGTWDVFLRSRHPTAFTFCAGDGSSAPCPCNNNGAPGYGCDNSLSGVLGAELTGGAIPSLSADTLTLGVGTNIGLATCVLIQGDTAITPVTFGDGLRCVAGNLLRLYVVGNITPPILFPTPGGPSISARSAAFGDTIQPGSVRHYQAYYRDPSATFCPSPMGDTFNITNGLSVAWLP